MKVSVIIPTYKPGKYIYQCLTSLYNQTLTADEFEVIIILNGCNKPWADDIKNWINQHTKLNVNFIITSLTGVSNARNIGLDNAIGEYIAFVDDDDYLSPCYLENLLKCSSRDCVGISDSIYYDDKYEEEILSNPHHLKYEQLSKNNNPTLFQSRKFFNGPCMKLLHRDIIGNRRFNPKFKNGEDNLMMFLISDRINSVKIALANTVYYRRIRENSATTTQRSWISKTKDCIRIMLEYTKILLKKARGYNIPFIASRYAAGIKSLFC